MNLNHCMQKIGDDEWDKLSREVKTVVVSMAIYHGYDSALVNSVCEELKLKNRQSAAAFIKE